MADGRARRFDHPGLFDLPTFVLALGRLRQLRLPDSGPRLRGAAELPRDRRRSPCLVVAWPDDRVVDHGSRHRVRSWARARARDGEDVPGTRDRHVDPHHPPIHQPGHCRPVVGAVPAKTLRSCRLPVEPAHWPPGRNQLDRRGSVGLFLDCAGRRVAVDTVHVRDPSRGVGGRSAAPLRGGGARRRRRDPDVPLCDAATARPGHTARRHAPPARRGEAVRRHLHVDGRRPRHIDLHDLLLSVSDRIPAVSPLDRDGGELDVSHSLVRGDHRARASSFECGDGVMERARSSSRTRPLRASVSRALTIGWFVIFVLVPLYWVVITSIKPSSDYLTTPPVWFPAKPTIVHYTAALFSYRGLQGLINSLIIASAATLLSTGLGTMMAYSLARFNTGGQHLALWVLSQRFLPPVAIVLPIFLLFRTWGLYDTLTGLILAYTFMTLPLSVWMMFAYFRQLPKSLEEAAWVDGLSRWQTFWMVATPLAAPGVAAAAVFVFIAVWTEFFFALILTSRHAFTLPTIFRAFLGFQGAQYGEACALAATSLVPSIVLGMLVQRHLVRGLTLGAIRG